MVSVALTRLLVSYFSSVDILSRGDIYLKSVQVSGIFGHGEEIQDLIRLGIFVHSHFDPWWLIKKLFGQIIRKMTSSNTYSVSLLSKGDLKNEESVLDWLIDDENRELEDEIEAVNIRMLEKLLDSSPFLAVFFCKLLRHNSKISNAKHNWFPPLRWRRLYRMWWSLGVPWTYRRWSRHVWRGFRQNRRAQSGQTLSHLSNTSLGLFPKATPGDLWWRFDGPGQGSAMAHLPRCLWDQGWDWRSQSKDAGEASGRERLCGRLLL